MTSPDNTIVMKRYNAGKIPLALVPTSFTRVFIKYLLPQELYKETARVLDFGAQKYDKHNWRKGGEWTSVYNSLYRHVEFGLKAGETMDPESGLDHWGHIGCNLAFLLEFARMNTPEDDRYKVKDNDNSKDREGKVASLPMFEEVMLDWLDGGPTSLLENAICIAAHLYHNAPKAPASAVALKVAA